MLPLAPESINTVQSLSLGVPKLVHIWATNNGTTCGNLGTYFCLVLFFGCQMLCKTFISMSESFCSNFGWQSEF